jgi:hypothetical protein
VNWVALGIGGGCGLVDGTHLEPCGPNNARDSHRRPAPFPVSRLQEKPRPEAVSYPPLWTQSPLPSKRPFAPVCFIAQGRPPYWTAYAERAPTEVSYMDAVGHMRIN